jgi:hypothetical protein
MEINIIKLNPKINIKAKIPMQERIQIKANSKKKVIMKLNLIT